MLRYPLTRIVVGIVVSGLTALVINSVLRSVHRPKAEFVRAIRLLVSASVMLATYYLLFRHYEKRDITELSTTGLLSEGLLGLLASAMCISLTIVVLYVLGYYEVLSIRNASTLLLLLAFITTLSVFEEVIFRGIIYRITEENLGTNLALIISALLFGLMHLPNEHANAISVISAASGGILLGTLFGLTRRLWLPIFFHAGWNWTQASLGVAVSGVDDLPVFIESRLEGPELITGGAFGPENSVITIVLVLALSGVTYYLTWKRGNIVRRASRQKGIVVE
jgi:membrane protease YdiL (CAAX protease family)